MSDEPLAPHPKILTVRNRWARVLWGFVWAVLYRPSPRPLHAWRRVLLRLFGAKVGRGAHPYPRAKIWAPWNLSMGDHSCIADYVDCYCVAPVSIGAYATVSQYSYLCTGSHDYFDVRMPLIAAPIIVEAYAWVAADAFVGPGVRIGDGGVVAARSTVIQDVLPWTVVGGSPAKHIGDRPRLV
jgi:putative colanic acid biosynthesis acetyltransferase WcaF